MAGYTRQETYTDGDVIQASHTNDEFDQLQSAFAATDGHAHDGSAGGGGPIAGLLNNTLTFGVVGTAADTVVTFTSNDANLRGQIAWDVSADNFEIRDDVLLTTTEKLQFRDTGLYINSSVDGQLDIVADGAVLIDTAGDITLDADGGDIFFKDAGTTFGSATNSSGNLIIKSGTTTALTFSGANATFAGNVTIGSAEISEAELEILDGATVTTDELNLLDGGATVGTTAIADGDGLIINDAGTMRVATVQTLAAYLDDEITAMPNLVSVGTLTALTIDDVLVDGKVITLTGSSGDTATITASANGALDIATTDAAGAAGNIQITADGTAELAGTTVTLDSSGGITLDADGGTITFADGGSSLGTVTSSGFTGNVVGNVTGNVSGSAGSATGNAATATAATTVTVTDNESTNEENLITFVEDATSSTGNVGLEMDGTLTYNPSTGKVTATGFIGALTGDVTGNVAGNLTGTVATATQNSITTATGLTSTGALNAGSITSGFGAIDNGASAITTTGAVGTGALTAGGLVTANANVLLAGTTPTLTIGDAGAEDAKIVFDGNAQDFYVGLDDSADDLVIGLGSAVGTTPAISIDENLLVTVEDDVKVDGRAVGHVTTDNDGSFDLAVGNDFKCTSAGDLAITFTNAAAGQSGNIMFVNGSDHTITAAATVAINADVLSTISASGTYHLSYFCSAASGNDTILVSASAILT